MLTNRIYYLFKPLIPRSLQIALRRTVVLRKLKLYKDIWPIDQRAKEPPEGWTGWPENKRFALVLTHDVDTLEGQDKCRLLMELEKNLGFRSSFNFVPRRYVVQADLRKALTKDGFEVGVHGLYHDGQYYKSREEFRRRAIQINKYLEEWGSVGFRSPSMLHNLDWIHDLNIEYDASTFDTDPFEPQPDGMGTIFPFWVPSNNPSNPSNPINSSSHELVTRNSEVGTCNLQPAIVSQHGYVELPYTLPQDFTLFILMEEKSNDIWKKKLDWIVEHGGMALPNVHPDYMNFSERKSGLEEYPAKYYEEFLQYVKSRYDGQYWHVLPKDTSDFWAKNMVKAWDLSSRRS
jgi:peptidoglycan/xylan/chitin deacetylase (PgdA/CDA1 family)